MPLGAAWTGRHRQRLTGIRVEADHQAVIVRRGGDNGVRLSGLSNHVQPTELREASKKNPQQNEGELDDEEAPAAGNWKEQLLEALTGMVPTPSSGLPGGCSVKPTSTA